MVRSRRVHDSMMWMRRFLAPLFVLGLFVGCASDDDVGRDFYELCSRTPQCMAGTECNTIAWEEGRDGAMCTAGCESDADCPYGGLCFGLVGDPVDQRVCFERCDLTCAPGFVCADAEMDGMVVAGICLPE